MLDFNMLAELEFDGTHRTVFDFAACRYCMVVDSCTVDDDAAESGQGAGNRRCAKQRGWRAGSRGYDV